MRDLQFAIIGTGFWARYQLAGWRELHGVRCIALCDRVREKAEALAGELSVPSVYDDAEELLDREKLDFVDIITDVGSHRRLVEMAAARKIPAICQKPMAPTLADAEAMVAACRRAGSPLFIHENWRWQAPIRKVKEFLDQGTPGAVFRARLDFCTSFPVFDNQPFLKEADQFIIADIGSHLLDTARCLFGESRLLFCRTRRIHQEIKGEDVATVVMEMDRGATVVANMSYASHTEHERFPETFLFIEGTKGSVELAPDYQVRLTLDGRTTSIRCVPPRYGWADPEYELVHASIVGCNANLLLALQTGGVPETSAEDNLKTMKLVFAAYESAREGRAIPIA